MSLPVPWDRKELGPWEKQTAQSPLNFDYRNKTWRRMLEEGLQLPGLGENGYLLSVPSNPASLVQEWGQKQLSGDESPSSALSSELSPALEGGFSPNISVELVFIPIPSLSWVVYEYAPV